MTHRRWPAAVLGLLALLLAPAASRADETEGDAPATVQWVDGFAAGAAAARENGRLLFVYVGRHHPT